MLYFLFVLFYLLFFFYLSLEDAKTHEIDDKFVYAILFFSLVVGFYFFGFNSLLNGFFAFLFSLFLYFLGFWALGDVFLFTTIGLLFPFHVQLIGGVPFFLASFLFSVLSSIPLILFYIFFFLKNKKNLIFGVIKKATEYSLLFSPIIFFQIFFRQHVVFLPIILFLVSFLHKKTKTNAHLFVFAFLLLTSFFLNPSLSLKIFLSVFFVEFLIDFVFMLIKKRKEAFVYEKSIDDLKDGDVLAEVFYEENGEIKRKDLSFKTLLELKLKGINPIATLTADGLDEEKIKLLKEKGINKVRVKRTVAYLPALLLGVILTLVVYYV